MKGVGGGGIEDVEVLATGLYYLGFILLDLEVGMTIG